MTCDRLPVAAKEPTPVEGICRVIASSLRLLNCPVTVDFSPSVRSLGRRLFPFLSHRAEAPALSLAHRANRAGSRGHNRRVCPLTFFRVTTDSSGDIKRQFKNDWAMTHDASAIGAESFFFTVGKRRPAEETQQGDEEKQRGLYKGPVDIFAGFCQSPVVVAETCTMTTAISSE